MRSQLLTACPLPPLFQGCAAGLTLAYFSQDTTQLQVLAKTGTPDQRRMAQKVLPLRKNGHLLLMFVTRLGAPRRFILTHLLSTAPC